MNAYLGEFISEYGSYLYTVWIGLYADELAAETQAKIMAQEKGWGYHRVYVVEVGTVIEAR